MIRSYEDQPYSFHPPSLALSECALCCKHQKKASNATINTQQNRVALRTLTVQTECRVADEESYIILASYQFHHHHHPDRLGTPRVWLVRCRSYFHYSFCLWVSSWKHWWKLCSARCYQMPFCSSSKHLENYLVHFYHHESWNYQRIVLALEERAPVEKLLLIRKYSP